jgi:uncharacterized protein YdeI (YjbR/CyaY-like superfamily)
MKNQKYLADIESLFDNEEKWQKEMKKLRSIILDLPLNEEVKWGCPCYTHQGNNVVLIHGFKEYCALLFFKGALLKDSEGILIQQTGNVQAGRQLRFTGIDVINKQEPIIRNYILEALEIEKAGLKVNLKKTSEFHMPKEFKDVLDHDSVVKDAFEVLTPGRQRAYLLYFSAPKQAKTREQRIEKSIPSILKGKGLYD